MKCEHCDCKIHKDKNGIWQHTNYTPYATSKSCGKPHGEVATPEIQR